MPRRSDVESESRVFTGEWQTRRKTAKDGNAACQGGAPDHLTDAPSGALIASQGHKRPWRFPQTLWFFGKAVRLE
jgi:hypothetical protein